MKRTNTILKTSLIWMLLIGLVSLSPNQSFAQNKKEVVVEKRAKKSKAATETVVVEVKDGKIYVDGKELADVDAEGPKLRVLHESDNKPNSSTIWIESTDDKDSDSKTGRFMFKSDDGSYFFDRIVDGEQMEIQGLRRGMAEAKLRSRMAPLMSDMMELKGNGNAFELYSGLTSAGNAETMKMDMRSRELAMKIRTADGDTSELESELDELLSESFASKQDSYQMRVDRLREELSELEQKLSDRKANKQDIISKRKKELLGKSDKYDW